MLQRSSAAAQGQADAVLRGVLPHTAPNPMDWVPSWPRKQGAPPAPRCSDTNSWNLKQQKSSWFGCNQNRCQCQSLLRIALWRYEELGDCQKDMRNPLRSSPQPVSICWLTHVPPLPTPFSQCLFTLAGLPCSSFPKNVCSDFLPAREAGEGFIPTEPQLCL